MVRIKLVRTGKRNQPSYRIVAQEKRSKRDGRYAAILGLYNPLVKPAAVTLDVPAYQAWLAKGAIPTDTVRKLTAVLIKS